MRNLLLFHVYHFHRLPRRITSFIIFIPVITNCIIVHPFTVKTTFSFHTAWIR